MTAEIVNLRRFRKERERAGKDKTAAENRASHGQTKTTKAGTKAGTLRESRALDGKRLGHEPGDAS